jgi:hypothetical protein
MRMPAIVPVHKITKMQKGVEQTESRELTTGLFIFLFVSSAPAQRSRIFVIFKVGVLWTKPQISKTARLHAGPTTTS